MLNNYTYKWHLDELGFEKVPAHLYTSAQNKKWEYVNDYLSPSIEHAKCGWDHCVYYVLKNKNGTEEYVGLYPDKVSQNGRLYCVTGNSLGAIAEQIWYGVFR